MSVLKQVHASETYIRAQVEMGLTTVAKAAEKQTLNLCEIFRNTSDIPQHDCTDLIEYLNKDNDMFTKEQRQSIASAAQIRCDSKIVSDASDLVSQTNLYLQHYYPTWLWAIIKSDDSIDNKLSHQASFMVSQLGIRAACERTKRIAVAIAQVGSQQAVSPEVGYDKLHALQAMIVRKRTARPGNATLKEFPRDPNEFWNLYPEAYSEDHPPVPCRIDERQLSEYNTKTAIPARCTNSLVKSKKTSLAPAETLPQKGDVMQIMLGYMMGNRHEPPTSRSSSSSMSMIDDGPVQRPPLHHGVPPGVGGLVPGVLQPPSREDATAAEEMAKIRATISKKAKNAAEDDDESEDNSETEQTADDDENTGGKPKKTRRKKRKTGGKRKNTGGKRNKTGGKGKGPAWISDPKVIKMIMKKPAKGRPTYSESPVKYRQSRLYFAPSLRAFRLYMQNKSEKRISVGVGADQETKEKAFNYACCLAEADK